MYGASEFSALKETMQVVGALVILWGVAVGAAGVGALWPPAGADVASPIWAVAIIGAGAMHLWGGVALIRCVGKRGNKGDALGKFAIAAFAYMCALLALGAFMWLLA